MANKKLKSAATAAEDQLKAGVKKLQEQLVTVEKAAGKLATRAKERMPAAADVKPDLPAVRERLEKARATMTRRKGRGDAPVAAVPPAAPSAARQPSPAPRPDDSWTVADLRAEAKRRGLTGYSRKTKAELLDELEG